MAFFNLLQRNSLSVCTQNMLGTNLSCWLDFPIKQGDCELFEDYIFTQTCDCGLLKLVPLHYFTARTFELPSETNRSCDQTLNVVSYIFFITAQMEKELFQHCRARATLTKQMVVRTAACSAELCTQKGQLSWYHFFHYIQPIVLSTLYKSDKEHQELCFCFCLTNVYSVQTSEDCILCTTF